MEQGAFTGLALADCITGTGTHAQFVKARKIINGTDRAEDIATHADTIVAALGEGLGLMPGVPTLALASALVASLTALYDIAGQIRATLVELQAELRLTQEPAHAQSR
jgi:hypothetical protein